PHPHINFLKFLTAFFNFQGFDWEGLNGRCLVPPILPTVVGQADTSNFDKYPRDENVPADELSGWDKDF
ncbi:MAG: hypothetical protein ACK56I_11795, partial [bacterium]